MEGRGVGGGIRPNERSENRQDGNCDSDCVNHVIPDRCLRATCKCASEITDEKIGPFLCDPPLLMSCGILHTADFMFC